MAGAASDAVGEHLPMTAEDGPFIAENAYEHELLSAILQTYRRLLAGQRRIEERLAALESTTARCTQDARSPSISAQNIAISTATEETHRTEDADTTTSQNNRANKEPAPPKKNPKPIKRQKLTRHAAPRSLLNKISAFPKDLLSHLENMLWEAHNDNFDSPNSAILNAPPPKLSRAPIPAPPTPISSIPAPPAVQPPPPTATPLPPVNPARSFSHAPAALLDSFLASC